MNKNKQSIEGITPITLKIASVFFICVLYFVGEIYFWGSEYYINQAPYILILFIALVLSVIAYFIINKNEPERKDSKTYAILSCIGFCLCIYALIPRINILTDSEGLQEQVYILDENNIWQNLQGYPELDVYLPMSKYWQQFKKGDQYTFQLRKGGLGIWLINMDSVYADQKKFYDCNGMASCMFVDAIDLSK